jgi:hypothetical protein
LLLRKATLRLAMKETAPDAIEGCDPAAAK